MLSRITFCLSGLQVIVSSWNISWEYCQYPTIFIFFIFIFHLKHKLCRRPTHLSSLFWKFWFHRKSKQPINSKLYFFLLSKILWKHQLPLSLMQTVEIDSRGTLNELGNLRLLPIIVLSLPKVIGLSFLHLVTVEIDNGGTLN